MAFTEPERARIRSLLGWGARFFELDDALENAMDAVSALSADETRVRELLTELTSIDALITGARDTAGVLVAGSIQLAADSGISSHRAEGRRLVATMGAILQVEVKLNYYGGGASLRGGPLVYG